MSGTQPILFVDRDGTLIGEPEDFQVDALEKVQLVEGVIPALLRIRDAGWQFVMVTNQDGLGTEAFPEADFLPPHDWMLALFESQGIHFREVLIDRSFAAQPSPNRKPAIGLVRPLLQSGTVDWSRSAMVGDRGTDMEFAANLGIRGFKLQSPQFGDGLDWATIAHQLTGMPRQAEVKRSTRETQIRAFVDLDRPGAPQVTTGIGFFDHMLEQIGTHAGMTLHLQCEGDLQIDEHHTVEDCALTLGEALRKAIGNKAGIGRYGFTLPMDETLATAALDWSGRPLFVLEGEFRRETVGGLHVEMVPHFFHSLAQAAGMTLHLQVTGENAHHQVEACFKAFARALRQAIARGRNDGNPPSSKGLL